MKGIAIDAAPPFGRLFEALAEEVAALFWLIDSQGGPFDYLGRDDWKALDRELDACFVDTAGGETGATLWRPGTLPRFARLLLHDEWSYFVGLEGPEAAARAAAEALVMPGGYLGPGFFTVFEERGWLFAVLTGSRWEVYSPQREWLERLAGRWQAEPVDSSRWAEDGA